MHEISNEDGDDIECRCKSCRNFGILRLIQLLQEGGGGRADINKEEIDEQVREGLVVLFVVCKYEFRGFSWEGL